MAGPLGVSLGEVVAWRNGSGALLYGTVVSAHRNSPDDDAPLGLAQLQKLMRIDSRGTVRPLLATSVFSFRSNREHKRQNGCQAQAVNETETRPMPSCVPRRMAATRMLT